MSALLDLLSQHLDARTLQRLSEQVGADHATTQHAVASALPVLVGALTRNADGDDAQALRQAVERDHDGSLLDNLSDVLSLSAKGGGLLGDAASGVPAGLSIDAKTVDGDGILGHLLGDRRAAAELGISKASGMDVGKVNRLLALLAPVVMSALGRLVQERGLDAGGLADLLGRTRSEMADDSGAEGLMGFLDADDDGQVIDDVAKLGRKLGGDKLLGRLFGG